VSQLVFPSHEGWGLELRNNLRRLLDHRRGNGTGIGNPVAWSRAAAYVSSLLDGDGMSTLTVKRRAAEIGLAEIDLEPSALVAAAWEIGAAAMEDRPTVSPQVIGDELEVTPAERSAIGNRQMRRIFAAGETADERKKRLGRERQARKRASNPNYTPRASSAAARRPWEALGISQRTYERRLAAERHAILLREEGWRDEKPPTAAERDEFPPPQAEQKRGAA
jgi:hypothetical protein